MQFIDFLPVYMLFITCIERIWLFSRGRVFTFIMMMRFFRFDWFLSGVMNNEGFAFVFLNELALWGSHFSFIAVFNWYFTSWVLNVFALGVLFYDFDVFMFLLVISMTLFTAFVTTMLALSLTTLFMVMLTIFILMTFFFFDLFFHLRFFAIFMADMTFPFTSPFFYLFLSLFLCWTQFLPLNRFINFFEMIIW